MRTPIHTPFTTRLIQTSIILLLISFLLIEQRQHIIEYFPYIILLACPLMHVFMHRHAQGQGHTETGHPDRLKGDEHKAHSDEQSSQKHSRLF